MIKSTKKPRPKHLQPLAPAALAPITGGDVYMHNPRGSDDRL